MTYDIKEVLIWAMCCLTVAFTATQISTCDQTRIILTCDTSEDEGCKEIIHQINSKKDAS